MQHFMIRCLRAIANFPDSHELIFSNASQKIRSSKENQIVHNAPMIWIPQRSIYLLAEHLKTSEVFVSLTVTVVV